MNTASRQRILRTTCLFALAAALPGQTASFHEDSLHGRRAYVLENDQIRVSTLPGGGYIGEIRFKSDDPKKSVNPMRVPHYQTIDPFTFDPAQHGALYGVGGGRWVMSGYMGHFLCFPYFGGTSKAESANGLGGHGEALAVEWGQPKVETESGGVTLRYGADLPKTQFRLERSITLLSDETVGYVEESAENLARFDRPVQWVQHITFGPPFVELGKNHVDAPVATAVNRTVERLVSGDQSPAAVPWPIAKNSDGEARDLRVFTGNTGTWMLDRSRPKVYFTMYNSGYPVLIGYIFSSDSNPWILDWQENHRNKHVPWDGKVVARGICIGDSPIGDVRNAIRLDSLLGTPVYSWIPARQRKTQNYAFFLAEIPLGFKGVADLRTEDGRIVIEERETGEIITLKSENLH